MFRAKSRHERNDGRRKSHLRYRLLREGFSPRGHREQNGSPLGFEITVQLLTLGLTRY